jgi:hypothetical protein
MDESSSWLVPAIQWGLWFVLMIVVMGWIGRDRLRPPAHSATGTLLRLPVSILAIGVTCAGLFVICAVFSYSAATGGPFVAAIFTLLAALGCYMIIEYFRDRYELRRDGVAYRTPLGSERFTPWADILWVRYSRAGKWIVLKLRNGRTLRLSVLLVGLPVFAEELLHNVDPSLIAEDSRDVLQNTSRGRPPSVWT